jgi:hypothetical protein
MNISPVEAKFFHNYGIPFRVLSNSRWVFIDISGQFQHYDYFFVYNVDLEINFIGVREIMES